MKHEASCHDENSFITLTYNNQFLPLDGSLSKRAIQLFIKRLRKLLGHSRVRYFACGEYGDDTWRPHYHIILFGYQFPDLRPWRKSPRGHTLYRSAKLETLWTFGNAEIGHVTPDSAGYVARYTLKKINGERALAHYLRPHPVTGEIFRVIPEFALMSRRPGIGGKWFNKYASDTFPRDYCVIDGIKLPVPDFYKKRLSEKEALVVSAKRKLGSFDPRRKADATPSRLAVREEAQIIRQTRLKRDQSQSGSENDT